MNTIIFADRKSLTPNENDQQIKQFWIDAYKKNFNQGAVQSDGTIRWDCPCLGTQAIGPCSIQFRTAFSCYQNSTNQSKGSECMNELMKMQECFSQYPKLYNKNEKTESQLNGILMNHPEARRQRMNESNKSK